jgi:hypothetical protein
MSRFFFSELARVHVENAYGRDLVTFQDSQGDSSEIPKPSRIPNRGAYLLKADDIAKLLLKCTCLVNVKLWTKESNNFQSAGYWTCLPVAIEMS